MSSQRGFPPRAREPGVGSDDSCCQPSAIPQRRGGTDSDLVTSEIDVAEQAVADVSLLIELGHLKVPTSPAARPRPATDAQAEELAVVAR